MNKLPPSLQGTDFSSRSICLVLEGHEEWCYFERLKKLNTFSSRYKLKLINAKSASNIPAKYQEALNSNSHAIVLIVCDRDRIPNAYNDVVAKIKSILGKEESEIIITYTRPCTLQIILLHFGDVILTTQAKKAARKDVFRLTGVDNYDAHKDQLYEICQKIYQRTWIDMLQRLNRMSENPDEIPSTNIKILFERLMSDDEGWIEELNSIIL